MASRSYGNARDSCPLPCTTRMLQYCDLLCGASEDLAPRRSAVAPRDSWSKGRKGGRGRSASVPKPVSRNKPSCTGDVSENSYSDFSSVRRERLLQNQKRAATLLMLGPAPFYCGSSAADGSIAAWRAAS